MLMHLVSTIAVIPVLLLIIFVITQILVGVTNSFFSFFVFYRFLLRYQRCCVSIFVQQRKKKKKRKRFESFFFLLTKHTKIVKCFCKMKKSIERRILKIKISQSSDACADFNKETHLFDFSMNLTNFWDLLIFFFYISTTRKNKKICGEIFKRHT